MPSVLFLFRINPENDPNISVEIMALRLRENKNINGIKVKIDDKAHIIKISQLADDTTLIVCSKTDIALAMNEIYVHLWYYT
jgi:dihydrodipicolinate synthase/N-acetylneuraminate lyase